MNHWLFLIFFFFFNKSSNHMLLHDLSISFLNFFLFKKPIMCSTCHCLKVVSGVMSFSCHPLISIVIPIYTMALPTVCRHKDMTWCWRSPEMAVGSVLQGQNVVYKLMFYNGKSTKKEKEILPWSYSKCINKVGCVRVQSEFSLSINSMVFITKFRVIEFATVAKKSKIASVTRIMWQRRKIDLQEKYLIRLNQFNFPLLQWEHNLAVLFVHNMSSHYLHNFTIFSQWAKKRNTDRWCRFLYEGFDCLAICS